MNYELAKELKEAGFPQGDITENHHIETDEKHEIVKFPTLEELIEACGDSIARIWRIKEGSGFPKWCATGTNDFLDEMGDTPAEAVARLWLSLKK